MVNKKLIGITFGAGVLLGIKYKQIYVTKGFQNPVRYKLFTMMFGAINGLAGIGESLGFGDKIILVRKITGFLGGMSKNTDKNVMTQDVELNGVKVRVYRPVSTSVKDRLPTMVFYHGGGYAFGSLDFYDHYLFEFVKRLNMVIISVDYRMCPDNPYPIPTDDCFTATKYVIEHPHEFGADLNRFVVAGDSSGGDAAVLMSMRLKKEKLHMPKLQLLIYPWVQKIYYKFPSHIRYDGIRMGNYTTWYLGINKVSNHLRKVYENGELFGLIGDENRRKFILDCLDVNRIPEIYKPDKSFYDTHSRLELPSQVPETSILKRDENLAKLMEKLFKPEISPLLASREDLVGLPKTYLLTLEWDALKDEALIFGERLKEAGVNTHVAFYQDAFHSMAASLGYIKSREMLEDLLKYLEVNL